MIFMHKVKYASHLKKSEKLINVNRNFQYKYLRPNRIGAIEKENLKTWINLQLTILLLDEDN